jgi:hypothetical protein
MLLSPPNNPWLEPLVPGNIIRVAINLNWPKQTSHPSRMACHLLSFRPHLFYQTQQPAQKTGQGRVKVGDRPTIGVNQDRVFASYTWSPWLIPKMTTPNSQVNNDLQGFCSLPILSQSSFIFNRTGVSNKQHQEDSIVLLPPTTALG